MLKIARFFFLAFDKFSVLTFLAGFFAVWIRPDGFFWWTAPAAVFLPWVSAFLVPATIILFRLYPEKKPWLHFVLVGMIAFRFFPSTGENLPEPSLTDLSLMSLNVPQHGEHTKGLKLRLKKFVETQNPNLIGFQEVGVKPLNGGNLFLTWYTRPLIDSLGYKTLFPYGAGPHTTQPVFFDQNQILGPTTAQQNTIMRYRPEEPIATSVVRFPFEWQGRPAVLYNIQLRSFSKKPWRQEDTKWFDFNFWIGYAKRLKEDYTVRATHVKRIRQMLAQETDPVIIMGDFNSTPYNWCAGALSEGFENAFSSAGTDFGLSYHARLISFARIDNVLFSNDWEVISFETVATDLSDHKPLLTRLRWCQ